MTVPAADTPEASGDLLAPELAVRTGALIGYARVSTSGQLLDRQQHALAEAGCLRIFADKLSGKNSDRPELAACLNYLRPGDTLVVPGLDRLSRSLAGLRTGNYSSLWLDSATISAMPSTGPSQSPADMLRRIRELQAAGPAVGHVTGQHLISKVLLKRFAEPSGPHRGLICPFRLEYPQARHRLIGADGCAKADNFVAWASASVERLWKETEDRLPDALAAMDAGTLFGNAEHVSVIKSAIALHVARSKATQVIHARVWAETLERGRHRWMTEHRQLLAYWFYREKRLYPAGDKALRIFIDEMMELSLSLADSGAPWRERLESLYLQARAITDFAGLEILKPPGSTEFLIGDVPALTVRADRAGVGVLGGIALAEAHSVFLPLGPRHAAALGRANQIIHLTPDQAAEVNARQLRGAIDYAYLRPGSPLIDIVRSFAEQRKNSSRTTAA